ncbi:MAG TPA: trypsin-like serine protease [Gaiellaceae bacterium]
MLFRIATRITVGLSLLMAAPAVAAVKHHLGTRPAAVPTRAPKAVGALFSLTAKGKLSGHFCTASVVHSRKGDVVVTAAHCLVGAKASTLAFVPGYHNHTAPLGIWTVKKILVDQAWLQSSDPDHDFAFLVVNKKTKKSLEALTGAERLGSGQATGKSATVDGYPSSIESAITCSNSLVAFSATQIEFDCDGYTNGTSGSAIVVGADPSTGLGTVIGVIGGYEQGGDTPSVSYAAAFTQTTQTLYAAAVAAG